MLGRSHSALRFSAPISRLFPERPLALIDYAVDLFHAGRVQEAAAAARRFTGAAAAVPLDNCQSDNAVKLRANARGFNEPYFWQVACTILLAAGDAKSCLDIAGLPRPPGAGNAALDELAAQAAAALGLPEQF